MAKEVKRKTVHVVAATIFGIVTFVHAIRIANGWPFTIGTIALPMWLSWIAVFVAGLLAVMLWLSSK